MGKYEMTGGNKMYKKVSTDMNFVEREKEVEEILERE